MLKSFPKLSSTRVVLATTAVLVVYFLVTGATTALQSRGLTEREGRVKTEIESLQQRYERLEGLRAYLDSDEYIESVAREQLGLVRQGETGIVVIPAAASPTPEADDAGGEGIWWETLIR